MRHVAARGVWRLLVGVSLLSLPVAVVADLSGGDDAGFGFGEPEVLKLDWATRSLRVHDINGNGLKDLAVINNDRTQIELLYQRHRDAPRPETATRLRRDRWEPQVADANFSVEKLTVGVPLFDLALGDLNGDGLSDLVYSSRSVPLTVRYQGKDGQWLETVEFDGFDALGWRGTLQVADIDGDGRAQVILLSADAIRVFSPDEEGRLAEPEVYLLTGENPFNLEVLDATGDGRAEIFYASTEGQQALVMREQDSDGRFGAERRFVLDRSIRMYAPILQGNGGTPRFGSVDSRSGSLEFFQFARFTSVETSIPLEGVQPFIYPIFKSGNEDARYSFADLDGDGERDLQVANPGGAEIMVYLKKEGRYQASRRFPSFSAISSLAGGRFYETQREAVVALSRDEKTVGVSHYDATGRLSFPRLIETGPGDPLVGQVVDLDQDGFAELAILMESGGDRRLVILRPEDRSNLTSNWEVITEVAITSVRRRPEAIKVVDVFGDEGPGLMLFVPREPPVLLAPVVGADSYTLEAVGEGSSIRESLLRDVTPGRVSEIDVTGDGRKELVVGRDGFARAIRFESGQLEMVDQFNARRSGDPVSAVIPYKKNGVLEGLVFYVEKEGELQFLERNSDGVLRYRRSEKVGPISLLGWEQFQGSGAELSAYLLYGSDRFWHFAPSASSWQREVLGSYETQIEDVVFSQFTFADFDGDGQSELIAVDGTENVVEILKEGPDAWRSLMFWQIFEQNMHYRGRTGAKLEPRETIGADLNGDGKLDFGFLIHDRILIYPQE